MDTINNESYREIVVEKESDECRRKRMEEYEELLKELCAKSLVLEQHGINPKALIQLLTREINVLKQQLK